MYSVYDDWTLLQPDCSIRISTDIAPAYDSPWLFAVSCVLLRLPVPRHPPCALYSLTICVLVLLLKSFFAFFDISISLRLNCSFCTILFCINLSFHFFLLIFVQFSRCVLLEARLFRRKIQDLMVLLLTSKCSRRKMLDLMVQG
jgi:hypothetical protein